MRYVPAALRARLLSAQQTLYNNADPEAVLWISRPGTVLRTAQFLERQTVLTGTAVTSVSLAARRPARGRAADRLYLAWVDGGTARLRYATAKTVMSDHLWLDAGWSADATAVAVAFDGTMPKADGGKVEFVTAGQPWVFWVDAGALYAEQLGGELYTLATENCSAVSAVRAMWSEVGGFDFGLVCFFLLAGQLYYRQLIDGVWTDAVPVAAAGGHDLTAHTFVEIAASRTWDYRVAVQLKDSTGVMHEIYTQFLGVGKQNVEHIDIRHIGADSELTHIDYTDTAVTENIEIAGLEAVGERIYGLSSMPVSATNIDDGLGNYGLYVELVLDYPVTGAAENYAAFVLTDENGVTFAGTAISTSVDGKTLTITFPDFNSAFGDLVLGYTPGTVQSPAVAMTAWTIEFTPTGLVPPMLDPPEVEDIWNE